MTSSHLTDALPTEFIHLLSSADSELHDTALHFVNKILNPADHFTYACQLLNCLESSDEDEKTATLLNGEFILYWLYREFEISLNPFLTHWTDLCENYEEEHRYDLRGDSLTSSGSFTRYQFIRVILAGKGDELSTKTPDEVERELKSSHCIVVNESKPFDAIEKSKGAMLDSSGKGSHLLDAAQRRKLEPNDESHLLLQIPQLANQLEIDTAILVRLLSHNPAVANSLVDSLLDNDYPDRQNLLTNILPHLDLELLSLDCINRLVSTDTKDVDKLLSHDERNHLLHLYIANGIREIDETSQEQIRKIRLLCLFLDNLLRKGIVNAEEFFYEFQEIRYRFIWVKEARNLSFRVFGDGEGG